MAIELELAAPVMVPKTIVDPAPTPVSAASSARHVPSIPYVAEPSSPPIHLHSELSLQEQEEPFQWAPPHSKGKGKAKATKEDNNEEDEVTQKLRKELENFVVLTKVAKAFLKQQGKLSQSFVLEGFKEKGKAKALIVDSEQMGTKRAFMSKEVVGSDSDEEQEERVHVIKKIKHEHIKEPIGASKGKETIELQTMVAPKMPMPTAAVPVSQPAPVKPADKSAIKGSSVIKDPFMVRQFKLVGTEESGALIINQVTEVAASKVASAVT
ncbi:hypothetical protein C0995_012984 [Termitomyces sp. Mi166|nr:hypothetical protein C0995_012984 [Termitomyces sp. Mi166\